MSSTDATLDGDHEGRAVPFAFSELFFSRTDTRGRIYSGNGVFRRVSQYGWDELVGKPHNIIRHPDMPRGVFYLLWDFLKRGKPIGAYVKNRAKDGRHYWVFAIVTPIEGGYLSVRLKPSSPVFAVVQKVYRALLAREREQKLSPAESAALLLADVATLGFDDYEGLMAHALCHEIQARDAALGLPQRGFVTQFERIVGNAGKMIDATARIVDAYESTRYVPLNLQILSAQLGAAGRGVEVISSNFSAVSAETQREISSFGGSARTVLEKVGEALFLLCTAQVQDEVRSFYGREAHDGEPSKDQEIGLLERQSREYRSKADQGLRALLGNLEAFQEEYRRLKQCATSLEVIRVMGKVDIARLDGGGLGLKDLIDELKVFQLAIAESLREIEKRSRQMTESVRTLSAA